MTGSKAVAVAAAAAILASCATPPPADQAARAAQALQCSSKPQCDRAWQRVQAWIAQNSRWRIQLANDVTIQTFGPGNSTTDTAYSAIRTLNADGSGRISFRAACDNIFRCYPEPSAAILAIKTYAVAE